MLGKENENELMTIIKGGYLRRSVPLGQKS